MRRRLWLGVVGLLIGVGAAPVAGTGAQASTATARHAIPLPSGSNASTSLCKSYFGSPSAIAKEFGVPTLVRTKITSYSDGQKYVSQVVSGPGMLTCAYVRPGTVRIPLNLGLSTQDPTLLAQGACCIIDARAGKVFAYAESASGTSRFQVSVSARLEPWLRAAAARAVPPR
jgi:hypothetical protein